MLGPTIRIKLREYLQPRVSNRQLPHTASTSQREELASTAMRCHVHRIYTKQTGKRGRTPDGRVRNLVRMNENTHGMQVLRMSMYALRQSPLDWHAIIGKIGLKSTSSNPRVFLRGAGDGYAMLTLFVDKCNGHEQGRTSC